MSDSEPEEFTGYPSSMTEASLLRFVERLCRERHVFIWHDTDSRRNRKGFPDVLLVGCHGVIWRELKSSRGTLTPEQQSFGSKLMTAGQDWAVWRPADLLNGTIRRQLNKIAGAPV